MLQCVFLRPVSASEADNDAERSRQPWINVGPAEWTLRLRLRLTCG